MVIYDKETKVLCIPENDMPGDASELYERIYKEAYDEAYAEAWQRGYEDGYEGR